MSPEHIRNFWTKVQKAGPDDCWIWIGAIAGGGYGALTVNGRMHSAHQLALILSGQPRPKPPHDNALHGDCSNPKCVNPGHLRWGSNADNMADMARLGRSMRGELTNTARLKTNDVLQIRASRKSYTQLAAQYGVKKSAIAKIKTGRTWRHI